MWVSRAASCEAWGGPLPWGGVPGPSLPCVSGPVGPGKRELTAGLLCPLLLRPWLGWPGRGAVWGAVPWCLMSVGSSSMSLSDRAVPIARAIFFIWEEKSLSILVLWWTWGRLGGRVQQDLAWCWLLPPKWGLRGPGPDPPLPQGCRGQLEGSAVQHPQGPWPCRRPCAQGPEEDASEPPALAGGVTPMSQEGLGF